MKRRHLAWACAAALLVSSLNGSVWAQGITITEEQRFEGMPDQWQSVPHVSSSLTQNLETLKALQKDNKLYGMVKGPGIETGGTWYIDADGDEKTGISVPYWANSTGIDLKVSDGQIWVAVRGAWKQAGSANEIYENDVRELELSLAELGMTGSGNVRAAFAVEGSQYLPSAGRLMLVVPPPADTAFGPSVNISVDGDRSDWQGVDPVSLSADGTTQLYAAQDQDSLVIMAHGKMAAFNDIFIDSDRSDDTGYTDAGWAEFGGDWLVENGGLYKSTGAGWNWGFVDGVDIQYAEQGSGDDRTIEYRIPLTAIGINAAKAVAVGLASNDIRVPGSGEPAPLVGPPVPNIVIDGSVSEWSALPLNAAGEGNVKGMKAFVRDKKLAVMTEAKGFDVETNIFIDSDNNPETGYVGWEYKRTGADYLIQNGNLYKSAGTGWAWNQIGPVAWKVSEQANADNYYTLETEADLSAYANAADTMRLAVGVGANYAPPVSGSGEYVLASGLGGGSIVIDGQDGDWGSVDTAVKGQGQTVTVRAAQSDQRVYLLVQGQEIDTRNEFYLDTDGDAATGFQSPDWQTLGADYLVKRNRLFQYDGRAWMDKGPVRAEIDGDYALFYFYQEQIGRKKPDALRIGYLGKEAYLIPGKGGGAMTLSEVLQQPSAKGAFEPKEQFGVLDNPYMGWMGWAKTDKQLPQPHKLVYAAIMWRDLEPMRGQFDWPALEKSLQFDRWAQEGTKINLRFVLDDPGNDPDMDIPQWLYDELVKAEGEAGAGKWYNTPPSVVGSGFAPNYNSKTLIAEHERVIQALAERYDNDPRIAFIQIGSLGHWGEFHNWPEEESGKFPSLSVSNQYVQHYLDSFKHKMIGMRKPFPIAADNRLGLFNDVFGSKGATDTWVDWTINGWNEIGAYVDPGQDPSQAQAASKMPDFWKHAFSGGEFHSGNPLLSLANDTIMDTLRQTRASHTSWLGPSSPAHYVLGQDVSEDEQANIDVMHNTMGYRFVLESLSHDGKAQVGKDLALSMQWNNKGVAPFYFQWPLAFALIDNKGAIVEASVHKLDGIDVRKWLPGRHDVEAHYHMPDDLKPGRYTLAVSILDKDTGRPGLHLGIQGERPDGWTELDGVTVSQ